MKTVDREVCILLSLFSETKRPLWEITHTPNQEMLTYLIEIFPHLKDQHDEGNMKICNLNILEKKIL